MAKRKQKILTPEQTAAVIDEIADRVNNQDYSFHIQVRISAAQRGLIELRHVEGLKLLTRISMLLLKENGADTSRIEYVRKRMESLEPLNPSADSAALHSLAEEIRVHK